MVKTIILIRHGESEKDKNNPKRGLTSNGISQIKNTAKKLVSLIENKSCLIITTKTKRTRRSAAILSKILKIKVKQTQIGLRVDNFDVIEAKYPKTKNQTFMYFNDYDTNQLESSVPAPNVIANRFLKIAGKLEQDLIIFVGHGAALESFVKYQSVFISNKILEKELEYGEFIVLERSK